MMKKHVSLKFIKTFFGILLIASICAGALSCAGGDPVSTSDIPAGADSTAPAADETTSVSGDVTTETLTDTVATDELTTGAENNPEAPAFSLDGKKVIFIGNSMIYYGGVVTKGGYRSTDTGWFYRICRENGMKTTVYDCTYGNHKLADFTERGCTTSGCDVGVGADLLQGINLADIDVIFMSEAGNNNSAIVSDVKNVMKRFTKPGAVFVYMCHTYTYTKNHTGIINNLAKLKDAGAIIVDWGHLCFDVYSGTVKVPGARQGYVKNTFVNSCSGDSHHPNPLAGYIAAQMCFCAVTGMSAVGQSYDMRTSFNYGAGSVSYDQYNDNYYTSSASNFKKVFDSPDDMAGLQELMDSYLAKWDAAPSDRPEATAACEHSMKESSVIVAATRYLPGLSVFTCEKCGISENRPIDRLKTEAVNLALGAAGSCYSASKASIGNPVFITDGDIADNASSSIMNAAWTSGGAADSFGGKLPSDDTRVVLADAAGGADHAYYYVVKIDLGGLKTVSGYAVYMHGYKKTVLDSGADILVSADGEHWTVVDSYGAAELFSGTADGKGYENYIDSDTAAASADDLPCYLAGDFAALTGIRYVAYGCTGYRGINGYYAARFTEFEVYGN